LWSVRIAPGGCYPGQLDVARAALLKAIGKPPTLGPHILADHPTVFTFQRASDRCPPYRSAVIPATTFSAEAREMVRPPLSQSRLHHNIHRAACRFVSCASRSEKVWVSTTHYFSTTYSTNPALGWFFSHPQHRRPYTINMLACAPGFTARPSRPDRPS
jgi:hypothetical protein